MQALRQELPQELSGLQLREEAHGTIELLRAHVMSDIELNPTDRDTLIGGVALGSILLEGPPGTGKTDMSKKLAYAIGGDYRRIQGVSDLQPSQINGSEIWHPGNADFEFRDGPSLQANVLMLDELNRIPPKSQAAFLEIMSEGQVTVAGKTYYAKDPLTVFATQNPLEEEGTNPIPFAELDRFDVSMNTIQSRLTELKILARKFSTAEVKREPPLEIERIIRLRKAVGTVAISCEGFEYIVNLRDAIAANVHYEPKRSVMHGRYKFAIGRAAQYHALARSGTEATVKKEDLVFGAKAAFNHRFQLKRAAARYEKEITVQDIIAQAIATTAYMGSDIAA